MNDTKKTTNQLIDESNALRKQVAEVDGLEMDRPRTLDEAPNPMAFYHHLLENIDEGILVMDKDDKIFFVNNVMAKIAGITKEQILGAVVLKDFSEDTLRDFRSYYVEAKESLNAVSFDSIAVVTPAGRMTYQSGTLVPVVKDGRLDGMICTFFDNTERKRAEEELLLMQFAMDQAPDSILLVGDQGNLAYANNAACTSMGYTREELLRMKVFDIDPDFPIEDWEQHKKNLKHLGRMTFEGRHRSKDGRLFPVEVTTNYFEYKGRFVGIAFDRDITERKRAEDEKRILEARLQRAEKMEALGTLAGGVAHDLNNVLGIVVGYAELLLIEMDKASPIRSRLLDIISGGEKAAAIVQDLLTLARRSVPIRQILNLNQIIVEDQHSPDFEKLFSFHPAIRIKIDTEPNLLNISCSPVHLSKTLFNLVSNACEAMPNGGVLTIRTANQYIDKPIQGYDEVCQGDYVVLSISDVGEGIPAADLKHIFEPFYTKKVMGRSGTGLGLAVVWGTVKDHNGYINVQSEEGKGSTFTLYFPVTREEIMPQSAVANISEYRGRGEAILVVDDVAGQRDLAAEMLRNLNYNVTSVSSGEEAIVYIKEHNIDLMVLDMIMDPGMDGLDTYRSVLEIHPKQKAIIVSGFSETERVITAQALGAGAYVRKPYILERLGLAVRKELDRK